MVKQNQSCYHHREKGESFTNLLPFLVKVENVLARECQHWRAREKKQKTTSSEENIFKTVSVLLLKHLGIPSCGI